MKNSTRKKESTTKQILQCVKTADPSNQMSERSELYSESVKPNHHLSKDHTFVSSIKDSQIDNQSEELQAIETEAKEIMKFFSN